MVYLFTLKLEHPIYICVSIIPLYSSVYTFEEVKTYFGELKV